MTDTHDPQVKDPSRRRLLMGLGSIGLTTAVIANATTTENAVRYRPARQGAKISATGYAFRDYTGVLAPLAFERRAPGPHDVVIEIHYCGICHSDIHSGLGHWGTNLPLPLVPGHEISGVVNAIGSEVSRFRVGERVGVGCMVDSCGHCQECIGGHEQYCENRATNTYGDATDLTLNPGGYTQGGYANCIVVQEDFVIRIPDSMDLAHAGPIMCAAVTVYSPLLHWRIRKGWKVGVVGMGGLGHMAVQIATAMGAEVVVFTTSPHKAADARRFGAIDVVIERDVTKLAQYHRMFDFILATVPYRFDLEPLFALLKHDATLCQVGLPPNREPVQLGPFAVAPGRIAYTGSLIGSIRETQDIIDFCAEHGIVPQVERIGVRDIAQAWRDVIAKKARYRYVIDMASLNSN